MSNKKITRVFQSMVALMELHDEDVFKIRSYQRVVFLLERANTPTASKSIEEMSNMGISKTMAEKIYTLSRSGTFPELQQLQENTPKGLLEILKIKGLGAKKIRAIWQKLNITKLDQLLEACRQGTIAKLKGFGEKTQQQIITQIQFTQANAHKMLFAQAEPLALSIRMHLENIDAASQVSLSGDIRRNMEVVEKIQLIVSTSQHEKVRSLLNELSIVTYCERQSGPRVWRGIFRYKQIPVEVKFADEKNFYTQLFLHSAAPEHLAAPIDEQGKTFRKLLIQTNFPSEAIIYQNVGMDYIPPEIREGGFELKAAKNRSLPQLVSMRDLKGVLHNHSTYSDGVHSLREMAIHCKDMGYEYLGISDHSQSAYYANGLSAEKIQMQHLEIDGLNEELKPFKIFKGIESDILSDGSLDYAPDILATFDFIVSSVHSNLNMARNAATQRLIRAIENPYTTILGHLTGRLLLRRAGYPIDHQQVIDACAANGVVIEINANPNRLDIDWRWVRYALEKEVRLSINPDAHHKDGYQDMRYGLLVGRKAGLTKEMTLNAFSTQDITKYFATRENSSQENRLNK